jgi:hypothetical protein
MRIAIMQPYLFPYVGYFQLMNLIDTFVILDDVQYINRGWINRNRILNFDKDQLFTFSLEKASSRLCINQRYFSEKLAQEKEKFQRMLFFNYSKAPHYFKTVNLVNDSLALLGNNNNIAVDIAETLKLFSTYLGIKNTFIFSSEIDPDKKLMGQDRIVALNRILGAREYYNLSGGDQLYSKDYFTKEMIDLYFVKSKNVTYSQFDKSFVPWLSIIDLLMFNTPEQIRSMLNSVEIY